MIGFQKKNEFWKKQRPLALVLDFPDVRAEGGPLLLSVVEVAVVAGDPLFGRVDGEAGVRLLLDGGRLLIQ